MSQDDTRIKLELIKEIWTLKLLIKIRKRIEQQFIRFESLEDIVIEDLI